MKSQPTAPRRVLPRTGADELDSSVLTEVSIAMISGP
jgi:hypothetical protein